MFIENRALYKVWVGITLKSLQHTARKQFKILILVHNILHLVQCSKNLTVY